MQQFVAHEQTLQQMPTLRGYQHRIEGNRASGKLRVLQTAPKVHRTFVFEMVHTTSRSRTGLVSHP